ncbi:MAG: T9SS type A sorting domain-containing protein [Flavobacteriia bacterium]|nr:T9SS type A sorting domain-containing protein [Flavobacteriia bacterium]
MKSILFLFLLIIHSLLVSQIQVGEFWGDEILVPKSNLNTKKQRGVLYNNIVATSEGRIIISTTELNSNGLPAGQFFSYSDDGGNNWSEPISIQTPNLVTGGASVKLAIDKEDTIYTLWSGIVPSALFISIYDKNLNLIKDSIRVANQQLHGKFASHFTIDNKNRIHVMWHEGNTDSPFTCEAFYTRSLDGGLTWETVQTLSNQDGHHSAFPHAEFDVAGDTLIIPWRDSVYTNNLQWDIKGVLSTNGGASWGQPFNLESTEHKDWDPDLIITPNGRIHLFYHIYEANNQFNAKVRYKFSDNLGSTWMFPSFPSNGQLSEGEFRSQLVEACRYDNSNNVLWISWKDERDFNFSTGDAQADVVVSYSLNNGLNWSTPEFVSNRSDSTVAFKAGTVLTNGEYILNYEVISPGNIQSDSTFLRVFTRKRSNPILNIDDNKLYQNDILIFPNHFQNQLFIQTSLKNIEIKLINNKGKEINNMTLNSNQGTYSIDGNLFENGLYFLQIIDSFTGNTYQYKIIKL